MDLVISFGHQTLCYRIVQLFYQRDFPIFPENFADEAVEVGPHRNHSGPGLVAFQNVHMPPEAAAAWIASHPIISRHAQRTIWLRRQGPDYVGPPLTAPDESSLVEALNAPGAIPSDVKALRVLSSPTRLVGDVLTGRLAPSIPLDPKTHTHLLCIARLPAGGDLTAGQPGGWDGQSCHRARRIGQTLQTGQTAQSSAAAKGEGASGVCADGRSSSDDRRGEAGAMAGAAVDGAPAEGGAGAGYSGAAAIAAAVGAAVGAAATGASAASAASAAAPVTYEYRWSIVPASWGYIMYRHDHDNLPFRQAPGSAVHKLDEALRLLGLHEKAHHSRACGTNPWAIDLGASPGAWTQHLSAVLGYNVIAVDPGRIAPEVLALPGVHHVGALSEDAVGAVRQLLAAGGAGSTGGAAGTVGAAGCSEGGAGGEAEEGACGSSSCKGMGTEGADILISDMNLAPIAVARVVVPLLSMVKPGGLLVLTLKLPGAGRNRDGITSRITKQLGDAIQPGSARCVWLLNNTACERTYIARRAGAQQL